MESKSPTQRGNQDYHNTKEVTERLSCTKKIPPLLTINFYRCCFKGTVKNKLHGSVWMTLYYKMAEKKSGGVNLLHDVMPLEKVTIEMSWMSGSKRTFLIQKCNKSDTRYKLFASRPCQKRILMHAGKSLWFFRGSPFDWLVCIY